ncbi:MAG: [Fe-S]-binding protein [Alphaproteobacteria bacterium]|nr:[Fe-S]-binding protein [Alphaproteobacteria bacterium]
MSNREFPIHTVQTDCQDCYKCVRRCPVKAIKIEDNSAMIVSDLCIACGTCYKVCPAKAKQPRDDLARAKYLASSNKEIYVSLAPSWITDFPGISAEQMVAAIRKLGIRGVSETALGAQEVTAQTAKVLKDSHSKNEKKLFISTACPAVVEYIEKYLPELTPNLANIASPLITHCRMLKDKFGSHIETIFVGPCIAKKFEADRHPDLLSVAISFSDLRQWFKEAGINPSSLTPGVYDVFVPKRSEEGNIYPIEGGMLETLKAYKLSDEIYTSQITGIYSIQDELSNLDPDNLDRTTFLECLACYGGCVSGPCTNNKSSGLQKRIDILKQTSFSKDSGKRKPQYNININYRAQNMPTQDQNFDEAAIRKVLTKIGKSSAEDELNCGGCGYDTCRNFAKALIQGKAEPEMCVSHMKEQAQRKANALIRCIPSPIVIADSKLNIIEYNEEFRDTFWNEEEHSDIYDYNNLNGANLRDFISFTNLFSASLDLEQDIHKEHVRHEDKMFDVVVFNIDKKQSVGGIIEDVTNSEMHKEKIAARAKEVIQKNLATVQQIACTLGEHMAETEVLLRSIAKDYAADELEASDIQIRTNSSENRS